MQSDEGFGNRQPKAEPSRLLLAGGRPLLECVEDSREEFGLNPQRSDVSERTTGITAANVAKLRHTSVSLPGTVDSSPIYLHDVKVGGKTRDVFFVTTTYGITLAVDAADGRILWRYTPPGYSGWAGSAQITTMTPVADPGRAAIYAGAPDGLRALSHCPPAASNQRRLAGASRSKRATSSSGPRSTSTALTYSSRRADTSATRPPTRVTSCCSPAPAAAAWPSSTRSAPDAVASSCRAAARRVTRRSSRARVRSSSPAAGGS
jgi:hypothetical protein